MMPTKLKLVVKDSRLYRQPLLSISLEGGYRSAKLKIKKFESVISLISFYSQDYCDQMPVLKGKVLKNETIFTTRTETDNLIKIHSL